eukprot:1878068-Amphidinium_carterae.1
MGRYLQETSQRGPQQVFQRRWPGAGRARSAYPRLTPHLRRNAIMHTPLSPIPKARGTKKKKHVA